MTDQQIIDELVIALKKIRRELGITPEFTPLGHALTLEPVIRRALKLAAERPKAKPIIHAKTGKPLTIADVAARFK